MKKKIYVRRLVLLLAFTLSLLLFFSHLNRSTTIIKKAVDTVYEEDEIPYSAVVVLFTKYIAVIVFMLTAAIIQQYQRQ